MKFKWKKCGKTYILLSRNTRDILPFWMPEAWVVRRKMYEDLAAAWFAYELDIGPDGLAYIGDFDTLGEAKRRAEARIVRATSRA